MRSPFGSTPLERLEYTVLLGLKSGPTCLVSDRRLEECLRGMSAAQRDKWIKALCLQEGLSAEPGERGVLFSRLGPEGDRL